MPSGVLWSALMGPSIFVDNKDRLQFLYNIRKMLQLQNILPRESGKVVPQSTFMGPPVSVGLKDILQLLYDIKQM